MVQAKERSIGCKFQDKQWVSFLHTTPNRFHNVGMSGYVHVHLNLWKLSKLKRDFCGNGFCEKTRKICYNHTSAINSVTSSALWRWDATLPMDQPVQFGARHTFIATWAPSYVPTYTCPKAPEPANSWNWIIRGYAPIWVSRVISLGSMKVHCISFGIPPYSSGIWISLRAEATINCIRMLSLERKQNQYTANKPNNSTAKQAPMVPVAIATVLGVGASVVGIVVGASVNGRSVGASVGTVVGGWGVGGRKLVLGKQNWLIEVSVPMCAETRSICISIDVTSLYTSLFSKGRTTGRVESTSSFNVFTTLVLPFADRDMIRRITPDGEWSIAIKNRWRARTEWGL